MDANTVKNATVDMFRGDRQKADRWLNRPAKRLGGRTPRSLLDTEEDREQVLRLINRYEHGHNH